VVDVLGASLAVSPNSRHSPFCWNWQTKRGCFLVESTYAVRKSLLVPNCLGRRDPVSKLTTPMPAKTNVHSVNFIWFLRCWFVVFCSIIAVLLFAFLGQNRIAPTPSTAFAANA
jgi:hypothetical protein